MKGKRKKHTFKVGNQAHLLRKQALATIYEGEELVLGDNVELAPSTAPSTTSSTPVSPQSPSTYVSQNEDRSIWLPRLNANEFKLFTKESYDRKSYVAPNIENCTTSVKLLRPIHQGDEYLDQYLDESSVETRVVDRDLTISMINRLFLSHKNLSPKCEVPNFELKDEKKWGLGWIWKMKCTKCSYVSESLKLYKEIEKNGPGRKAAAINYAFQTGITNSNLGNDSARLILSSAGIPPISRNGMQKIANKVCDKVVELAEDETNKIVENIQKRNLTLGLKRNHPIKVQMDGTYQSINIKSRHKMGQNASQLIGTACEDETDSHDIISYHLLNKLCWVGAWLRGQGYDVICPDHENCTANTNRHDPLSEKDLGYEIGMKIGKKDLLVDYCTTDGDATSAKGLEIAMKELFDPLWAVKRLADTVHRGQSQFRQGLKAKFSAGMFPGLTKAEKNEMKTAFANDIKLRTHGIMKSLFAKYSGDRKKISQCLPRIVKNVVNCYSGFCGDTCRWSVTLCKGGKTTSWWYKSIGLCSHGLTNGSLKPNEADKMLIAELIEMKLSQTALDEMKFFSNTNKCETINRTISTYLPKNKTFSRNAVGRTGAAMLKVNHKRDVAIVKTLKAVGAPLGKSSKSLLALKKIRRREDYDSAYQKRVTVKLKRLQARKKQAVEYLLNKAQRKTRVKDVYRKHQLEPTLRSNGKTRSVQKKSFGRSDYRSSSPQPGCSRYL